MNSNEDSEHEREPSNKAGQWSVFGSRGGQIGPVMVSTDRTVLRATATILGAVGFYGFAGWLTLSLPVLTGVAQWAAIGLFAGLGLLTIHTTLVEIYSNGVRTAIQHQPTQSEDEDEDEDETGETGP